MGLAMNTWKDAWQQLDAIGLQILLLFPLVNEQRHEEVAINGTPAMTVYVEIT